MIPAHPTPGSRRITPQTAPSATPSAAAAFLRGIERRAAVFAQWQGGDIETGDAALARTMVEFLDLAPRVVFAEWPRRFWSLLLASPALRAPQALGTACDGLPALATLGGGPRVTVLLRLVAGMPEHEAAAVLGVSRATYRLGLQRALPHLADGAPDAEAWRALAASVQADIRALPPDRLARLAGLREAALRGQVLAPRRFPLTAPLVAAAGPDPAVHARPRWLWPAMAAVGLATLAALALTVPWFHGGGAGDEHIRVEALPESGRPAARYDDELALLTERDFELLVAPGDRATWQEDPAFHAWLAAQLELPQDQTADVHLDSQPESSAGAETRDDDF